MSNDPTTISVTKNDRALLNACVPEMSAELREKTSISGSVNQRETLRTLCRRYLESRGVDPDEVLEEGRDE